MGCHLQSFNLMIIKNKLRSNKSNGHSHVQAGEREREREREKEVRQKCTHLVSSVVHKLFSTAKNVMLLSYYF